MIYDPYGAIQSISSPKLCAGAVEITVLLLPDTLRSCFSNKYSLFLRSLQS